MQWITFSWLGLESLQEERWYPWCDPSTMRSMKAVEASASLIPVLYSKWWECAPGSIYRQWGSQDGDPSDSPLQPHKPSFTTTTTPLNICWISVTFTSYVTAHIEPKKMFSFVGEKYKKQYTKGSIWGLPRNLCQSRFSAIWHKHKTANYSAWRHRMDRVMLIKPSGVNFTQKHQIYKRKCISLWKVIFSHSHQLK